MRTLWHLLGIGALLLGAAGTGWGQGSQRLPIPDNQGFGQPMTAYTIEVPAGWQAQGGVFWDPSTLCQGVVPSIRWQTWAPDGSQMFEILPRWVSEIPNQMGQMMPGCQVMDIASVRQYLEYLARQRHPDARVLDYRERPDLKAKVQAPPAMPSLDGSSQNRNWTEAGELLVGWNENGVAMREALAVNGVFMEMQMNMPLVGHIRTLMFTANAAAVMRAPDGYLDFGLFARILASVQPDPGWQARMSDHQAQMAGINRKGMQERAAIRNQTAQEISEMRHQTWMAQQRSSEKQHTQTIEAIRGVQPYHDPNTGHAVELSNEYDYSWRLNNGTYYQTNDPNFNPYLELGIEGQQMAPVQR